MEILVLIIFLGYIISDIPYNTISEYDNTIQFSHVYLKLNAEEYPSLIHFQLLYKIT